MPRRNLRKWYPCAKCGAPDAGRSVQALCLEHRVESRRAARAKFYRQDANERAARYRDNRRKKLAAAKRTAARAPVPVTDAIALYRAEKAKREARTADAIATARALLERATA